MVKILKTGASAVNCGGDIVFLLGMMNNGNIYVGQDEADVRKRTSTWQQKLNLQQDKMYLDTWFSSALWPFSTLGWPEQTKN